MKKKLKLSDSLYNILSDKYKELEDNFDFWLIKQNIHEIKGVSKLLELFNEGNLLGKYMVIEKPKIKRDDLTKGFTSSYGYTVTSNEYAYQAYDSYLLIPKNLAKKLTALESFKI